VLPSRVIEQVGEVPLNVASGLRITLQLEQDLDGPGLTLSSVLPDPVLEGDAAPDLAPGDLVKGVFSDLVPHCQFSNRPGASVNFEASTSRTVSR
jgi:hypothetical protein